MNYSTRIANHYEGTFAVSLASTSIKSEIQKEVIKLILTGKYPYVGIRYEDKKRSLGDICEDSKNNLDREDERDFPSYGDDAYDKLPSMGGTSAWSIYNEDEQVTTPRYDDDDDREDILNSLEWDHPLDSHGNHTYIVGGKHLVPDRDSIYDDGEIVIEDAEVLYVVK